MKQIIKLAIFILVVFALMLGASFIKKHRLGGFRLSKLMKASNNREFPEFFNDKKLNGILSNDYRYLGKGTQFYAFVSEDQKYVVKVLRSDRLTLPLRKRLLPSHVLKLNSKNKRRKDNFFKACKIAFYKLKEQTGVIYLHLKPTVNLPKINIIDNFGFNKSVDLNAFCFIVQKKAVLIKNAFIDSKKQNDVTLAKKKVSSFFNLLKKRAKNEVSNTDPNVFQNFGYIKDVAVEIDFGDFYNNPYLLQNDSTYASEINKYALVLRSWIVDFWPELLPYFDEQHSRALNK